MGFRYRRFIATESRYLSLLLGIIGAVLEMLRFVEIQV